MKHATILGLAIGDALGQPFEFLLPKTIIKSGWQGDFVNRNKKRERKPGQWTDDTKMALCIADSLIENQSFVPADIAIRYVDWFKSGDLRGIGIRCEESIKKLLAGVSYLEAGKKPTAIGARIKKVGDPSIGDFCGNGTLMRVAPIGVMYRKDAVQLKEVAINEANITHHHPDARDASWAMATIVAEILNGADVVDAIFTSMDLDFEYTHVPNAILSGYKLSQEANPFEACLQIGASGTAHQTFGTAIYSVLKEGEHFHNSLVTSILMGGDTDTRAAVVGAILGAAHPEYIPEVFIQQVEDSERLRRIDKQLLELSEK